MIGKAFTAIEIRRGIKPVGIINGNTLPKQRYNYPLGCVTAITQPSVGWKRRIREKEGVREGRGKSCRFMTRDIESGEGKTKRKRQDEKVEGNKRGADLSYCY